MDKILNKNLTFGRAKKNPIKEVDFVTKALEEYRMRPKSPPPREIVEEKVISLPPVKKPSPKKIVFKTPSNYGRELELIDINKNNKQRRTIINKLQAKK